MPHRTLPSVPVLPALMAGLLALAGCGEPIPNAPTGPNAPERQVIAQSVDTHGRVIRDRGVLVVETRGTLFQAGVQQGTLLRERIRDQLRDYHERRAFPAFMLTPGFVHRLYAGRQERHLTLDEKDFLRGLSMGSGLRQDEVLLLSAEPPYAAFSDRLAGLLPGGGGFVARGKASRDGAPLLGRVSDDLTFGIRQRFGMLWVHHPLEGPAWVALTRVASLDAEAAWTEGGLHVSIDPVAGKPRSGGLPPRWLTLRLMTAKNADAAEATLRQAAPSTSQAFVGTLAQGDEARILEAHGSRVTLRSYGSGGALPDLAQTLETLPSGRTDVRPHAARGERLSKLLASSYGSLDALRAMEVLTDLNDPTSGARGPVAHSVSRALSVRMALGPLVLGDWGRLTSTTAVVAQPREGRIWLAMGREQLDAPQNFVDFRLPELLGRDAKASVTD